MAYSTYTSILTILPGLPQTSTANGWTETTIVVAKHITRADSIIDGMISQRYDTPVSNAPLLNTLSEDITAYFTYRSFYTQDNMNRSEYFDDLRSDAMEVLEKIRKGDINLVDTAGSAILEPSTSTQSIVDSNNKDYQPFFDVDSEYDWKFDDDLIEDIRDKR